MCLTGFSEPDPFAYTSKDGDVNWLLAVVGRLNKSGQGRSTVQLHLGGCLDVFFGPV